MKVGGKQTKNNKEEEKSRGLVIKHIDEKYHDRKSLVDKIKKNIKIFTITIDRNINEIVLFLQEYDNLSQVVNAIYTRPELGSDIFGNINELDWGDYNKNLDDIERKEYIRQSGYSGINVVIERERRLWNGILNNMKEGKLFYHQIKQRPILQNFGEGTNKVFSKKISNINKKMNTMWEHITTREKQSTFDSNSVDNPHTNANKHSGVETGNRIHLILSEEKKVISNFIKFVGNFEQLVPILKQQVEELIIPFDNMNICVKKLNTIFNNYKKMWRKGSETRVFTLNIYRNCVTPDSIKEQKEDIMSYISKVIERLTEEVEHPITDDNNDIKQIRGHEIPDRKGDIFPDSSSEILKLGYHIANNFIDIRNGHFGTLVLKTYINQTQSLCESMSIRLERGIEFLEKHSGLSVFSDLDNLIRLGAIKIRMNDFQQILNNDDYSRYK